jgi:hypothetical protein
MLEVDAELAQALVLAVKVLRLEVQRDLFGVGNLVNKVDRERTIAGRALKPQVVLIFDDEGQSEVRVEAFGSVEVRGPDRHLIELHQGQSSIARPGQPASPDNGVSLDRGIAVIETRARSEPGHDGGLPHSPGPGRLSNSSHALREKAAGSSGAARWASSALRRSTTERLRRRKGPTRVPVAINTTPTVARAMLATGEGGPPAMTLTSTIAGDVAGAGK